jgi:hypothetical protein
MKVTYKGELVDPRTVPLCTDHCSQQIMINQDISEPLSWRWKAWRDAQTERYALDW